MNAALWGFLGTIVGGAIVFLTTVWQQHVSHEHEREMRRRDFQLAILSELREAVTDLVRRQEAASDVRRKTGEYPPYRSHRLDIAEAGGRVRMLGSTVLDEDLRDATERLSGLYSGIESAGDPDDLMRLREEAGACVASLMLLIGKQLRALYGPPE